MHELVGYSQNQIKGGAALRWALRYIMQSSKFSWPAPVVISFGLKIKFDVVMKLKQESNLNKVKKKLKRPLLQLSLTPKTI